MLHEGARVKIIQGTPCVDWRDNSDVEKLGTVVVDDLLNCEGEPVHDDMRWLVRLDENGFTLWYNTSDLEVVS
jgi:hypothetical protein